MNLFLAIIHHLQIQNRTLVEQLNNASALLAAANACLAVAVEREAELQEARAALAAFDTKKKD